MTWAERGTCAQLPVDIVDALFFPDTYSKGLDRKTAETAKRVCAICPVRDLCLREALNQETQNTGEPLAGGGRYGIWGGLTPRERARMAHGEYQKVS